MALLNPLLLWGMAAVAAPIIIHMFMNRKVKQVVWAATRFLRTSIKKNQRRMNLEDIILLLMRCLLLILLALAMARPVFRGSAAAAMAGRNSETAVIAIDNSYSMGQSDGGPSRFDLAKQAATQVLDSMPKGSSAAVLLFSDVVHAPIPEPTFDLDLARKVVHDAGLSDRTTDVQPMLKQAFDILSRHEVAARRIYLVTDGQANAWGQFDDILKMLHNENVRSSVILVGGAEENNRCVSKIQLASSMASVGEEEQFDVEVTNFGSSDARDVAVRLNVDDETPCDEGTIASISPGASKRLALFTKFRTPGYHTVTGQINPDGLTADDKRTMAVRVQDDVRVLLVTGDVGGDPVENATFYLANALAPVPPSERADYFVKTKTITPAELDTVNLGDYEAVVLADVPDIPPVSVDALPGYLSRGGGLIIFPGPKTDAAFYNNNFSVKYNLLPATLGGVRGKPNEYKTVLHLQASGYDNRMVSIWNDAGAGTLASANYFCSVALTPLQGRTAQAGEPEVVVKYNDGSPAIMERTWGCGRVILFSSSANTAWNDMPLHPAYLPLVDRMLGAIIDRQNDQLNIPVGGLFELVCDQNWVGQDVIVKHAGDTGSPHHIDLVDGVPLLRFNDTEHAGAYEATVKTDPPTVIKFAARFNPVESDLQGLAAGQLDSLKLASQVVQWTPETRLDTQIKDDRKGTEIWTILAMLVIAMACIEALMGGIFSAAK